MLIFKNFNNGGSLDVRRPEFKFKSGQDYISNKVIQSHMSLLSALFPYGEQFFVDSIRHYQPFINDAQLKLTVSGFIGQESMHSKEHRAINDALEASGHDVIFYQEILKPILVGLTKITTPKQRLGITMCAEHFTGIMAPELLKRYDIQRLFTDSEALKLWLWHAVEECEHKCVAADVWNDMGFDDNSRRSIMLVVAAAFIPAVVLNGFRLLKPGSIKWPGFKQFFSGVRILYGPSGFYSNMVDGFFDWFKPGFHPSHHDTSALEKSYKVLLDIK